MSTVEHSGLRNFRYAPASVTAVLIAACDALCMTDPMTSDRMGAGAAVPALPLPPLPAPTCGASPPLNARTAGLQADTARCMENSDAVRTTRDAAGGRSSSGARCLRRRNVSAVSRVRGEMPASGMASDRCCRFCTHGAGSQTTPYHLHAVALA